MTRTTAPRRPTSGDAHESRRPKRRAPMILVPFLFLSGLLTVSCGDDDDGTSATTTTPVTAEPATAAPPTAAPPTAAAPATAAPTTTASVSLERSAIWPAAGVVFTTPEEAAADFVEQLLGVPPVLGEFMAGDNRSGEIEVFSPGEGGPGSSVARSLLLLRQLGPDDGWFVLAAIKPEVSIESPANGAVVPAAPLVVSGPARGFEATILVKAVIAGTTDPLVDPVIAMGGALETPEPYSATIDLSGVPAGTMVTILVRGDTGLETDPGEFSASAVVIAG